ncbi:exosortase/archaeosortase family protein [Desulfatirhabdium butyrativorans]|uniref:exosortase/archaeosortase family protein n=1 Tax=Desulfatirhabdium butyrativorans TaxID=340467 RepID=UPI00042944DE|nr:exosortase/archaeosortase family protein [Desulfatirhabdium butyrativorans]
MPIATRHRMPVLGIAAAGILAWLYMPILSKLVSLWFQEPEYAQGIVLTVLASYLVWDRRNAPCWFQMVEEPVCWRGSWIIIITGLLLLTIGHAATEFFSQRISFFIVLWGLIAYGMGPQAISILWEPAVLMMMAVPLPAIVVDTITLPLKTLVSILAAAMLHVSGYSVVRYGNILDISGFHLEVVSACSGIRSFFALLAITIVLSAGMRSIFSRLSLFFLLVPVVILSNALRIVSTAALSLRFPAHSVEFYDGFAGWAAFLGAFGFIVGVRMAIDRLSVARKGRE